MFFIENKNELQAETFQIRTVSLIKLLLVLVKKFTNSQLESSNRALTKYHINDIRLKKKSLKCHLLPQRLSKYMR